jgi:L-ribulose-5-phosphate 3-epimerase
VSMVGIMQGRLVPPEEGRFQSFPRLGWQEEFTRGTQVPIQFIEWIYDEYGYDVNPLASSEGVQTLRQISASSGIRLVSVCADYFMDRPLVRCTEAEREQRLGELTRILTNGSSLGVNRVVIPFVDASAIRDKNDSDIVVDTLKAAIPAAEDTGVELHLETSLGPADFARLLDRLTHPKIKANYDSGNSSSLGYRPAEEFSAYGERIGSVHIKDRVLNGGTVPLGTGDADFDSLFAALEKVDYKGDFTLQVARGTPGDEVAWTRQNLDFLRKYWQVQL